MSITRRNARRSVRILGVASASAAVVLGLSSTASACVIGDFKAEAKCDGAKGVIVVTDNDAIGTPAHITVFRKDTSGVETKVGEKEVKGSAAGTSVTIPEDWKPSATYRVHIKAAGNILDEDTPDLTTPSTACKTESSTPTPPASPKPSPSTSAPAESASPTPSDSASHSAPASAAPSNAPSPAAGSSNLAETGASSNTPLIAGIAGALVVVGGGAVWFGMRRRGARGNS
ncbi:LAETG motif-containing sortase-dependent surface protein [Streptomyces sp. NPDC020192]|uniref:LAETG motif-containing sortase-dependent surface protein n=1 Tax=Streptomyces sp. NPDC020192 TaxID=3365066 RepID=UPI0037B55AE9